MADTNLLKITTIAIATEAAAVPTVNARELHAFLENGDAFANWVKDRIRQYDFVDGRDFTTFLENGKKGRPSTEYALTLDMAKELAMVERNEKGKQARLYFIECERRLKEQPAPDIAAVLNDPASLQNLLLFHVEKRIEAEKKVAELIPKAVALDRIAAAEGTLTLRDAAKVLGQKPKAFVATLLKERWIYRQNGSGRLIGYQDKVDRGLVDHRFHIYESEGADKASSQAVITAKGLAVLGEKLGAGEQLGFNLH